MSSYCACHVSKILLHPTVNMLHIIIIIIGCGSSGSGGGCSGSPNIFFLWRTYYWSIDSV
jgi:hypothetical protein